MDIRSNKEVRVTIAFSEREAKLLTCLVGSISPKEAEEIIQRGIYFKEWVGKLEKAEVAVLTGTIYDTLYDLFENYS